MTKHSKLSGRVTRRHQWHTTAACATMFSSEHEDLDALLSGLKQDAVKGAEEGVDTHDAGALAPVTTIAASGMWDASITVPATIRSMSACSRGRPSARPSAIVEVLRRKAMSKLHAKLESLVVEKCGSAVARNLALKSSITLRNGDATFDRWVLSSQLGDIAGATIAVAPKPQQEAEYHHRHRKKAPVHDPLLPVCAGANAGLVAELCKAGSPRDTALEVASAMSAASARAAEAVARRGADLQRRGRRRCKVIIDEPAGVARMRAGKASCAVTLSHYRKLRELYDASGSGAALSSREVEEDFNERVAALAVRYEALGGSGYQAACPGAVFDALRDHFSVRMECFASPFNCRWRTYCSAFVDTDAMFGSVGSFFQFKPTTGSYEANPPFEPVLITAMQVRAFLEAARPWAAFVAF